MSASEQKPSTLAIASHGALCVAGANSLAARARADLRNREEAEEWLRKGLEFRAEYEFEESFRCFDQGIRLSPNHPELLFFIGTCYFWGSGAPKDEETGIDLFRRACLFGKAA